MTVAGAKRRDTLLPVSDGVRFTALWCRVVQCVVAMTLLSCARAASREDAVTRRFEADNELRSNILREDYAGSDACAGCHAGVHTAWLESPMHKMTRLPEAAHIRAPFDGASWSFKDDEIRFEKHEQRRYMRLRSREQGEHLYRVTRVIGGRYREDFAGLEVSGTDARAHALGDQRAELILPASYVFETESFRLKGYSVMVGERRGLRAGGIWNEACIFCHNTVPYFPSLWGELHGPGAPGYQGQTVDKSLPAERRFRIEITDEDALQRAVTDELEHIAAPAAAFEKESEARFMRRAILEMRRRFGADHFVELGIGCEACHGGSREHIERPRRRPTFEPKSRFLRVRPSSGEPATRAEQVNRTCARCHQVLFSRYPFTWEGGLRRSPEPGGSSINSGEARDLLLGGCSRELSCVQCHDPHAEDSPDRFSWLASPAGNVTCTGCHQAYSSPAALRKHAHHDPKGAGASCVGCHMPRKNAGLTYGLTRYHRIGSPTDRVRVEEDRPLECALCHPKASVEELVTDMERFWNKRYDRERLRLLYGNLKASPLLGTLDRGKSHEQMVALLTLGEHGVRAALPRVARWLVHPTPLVRYYAKKAFDELAAEPCPIDLDRHTAEIAEAVRLCVPGLALPTVPTLEPGSRGRSR